MHSYPYSAPKFYEMNAKYEIHYKCTMLSEQKVEQPCI